MINFLHEPTVTEYRGSKRYTFSVIFDGLFYEFVIILESGNTRTVRIRGHKDEPEGITALIHHLSRVISRKVDKEPLDPAFLDIGCNKTMGEVFESVHKINISTINGMNQSLPQRNKDTVSDAVRLEFILNS